MNKSKESQEAVPGGLERKLTATIGVILIALILWALLENHLFRFAFVLGGFCAALVAIVFAALFKRGFRWFASKRALRFHFWVLAGILSFVVLFYAEERWRGNRAWTALQKEAADRGESLELSSIIPTSVPNDQNFAKAVGVAETLRFSDTASDSLAREKQSAFFHGLQREWLPARWCSQQGTDLQKWVVLLSGLTNGPISHLPSDALDNTNNAAATLLQMMRTLDPSLDVLRKASSRPLCRYPIDYKSGWAQVDEKLYSILTNLRQAAHALSLRASALVALGRADDAADDILLALRLAETLREEPFISAHYTRNQMLMHAIQPLWEGFAAHVWKENHLNRFHTFFTEMDPISDASRGTRGEAILLIDFTHQLENYIKGRTTHLSQKFEEGEKTDAFGMWLFRTFYPSGWLAQDRVWIYQFYRKYASDRFEDSTKKLNNSTWKAELFRAMDPMLLVFVVPRMKEVCDEGVEWGTYLKVVRDQILAAVELERFRASSNNRYPKSLDELVPSNLKTPPRDPLAGDSRLMTYRVTDSTNFILCSVGFNGIDDGGKPVEAGHHQDLRLDQNDWVWTYR